MTRIARASGTPKERDPRLSGRRAGLPNTVAAYSEAMTDYDHEATSGGEASERDVAQYDQSETLDTTAVNDPLDTGIAPPSYAPPWYGRPDDFDPRRHETIEDRLTQEVPDPQSAYGAPDNESGMDAVVLGGDDPDAIAADDDWIGNHEVGRSRAGRLVASDEGARGDDDGELYARDEGVDGGAASAEEAAMHVIDDDDDGDGDDWA